MKPFFSTWIYIASTANNNVGMWSAILPVLTWPVDKFELSGSNLCFLKGPTNYLVREAQQILGIIREDSHVS